MVENSFVPHRLRVQHRTGQIEELAYVRLLAVDDVPYVPEDDHQEQFRQIEHAINDLHHRLQASEQLNRTIVTALATGRTTTGQADGT